MVILLIGPSGCGKGTQAELLSLRFHLPHIEMGGLLRQAVVSGSGAGDKISRYLAQGRFVPTSLAWPVLRKALSQEACGAGFILDGYPRIPDQPPLLERYLTQKGQNLKKVFYLETPPAVAWARVMAGKESDRKDRSDDRQEIFAERIKAFEQSIEPILKFYRAKGELFVIDNRLKVEAVHSAILQHLPFRRAPL